MYSNNSATTPDCALRNREVNLRNETGDSGADRPTEPSIKPPISTIPPTGHIVNQVN